MFQQFSTIYNELLEYDFLSFINEKMDTCGTCSKFKSWYNEHSIPVLYRPACSSDLNPMDNLWGYMVCKVYSNNAQNESIMFLTELKVKNKASLEGN